MDVEIIPNMSVQEIHSVCMNVVRDRKPTGRDKAYQDYCNLFFKVFCKSYGADIDFKKVKGVVPANMIKEALHIAYVQAISTGLKPDKNEIAFKNFVVKSVNQYAQEGVDYSMSIRHSVKGANPSSPTVPSDSYQDMKIINKFFNSKSDLEMFKSANAVLTRAYLRKVLGMRTKQKYGAATDRTIGENLSAMEFVKNSKDDWDTNLTTVINRYYQYVVSIIFAKTISQALVIPDKLIEDILANENVLDDSISQEKLFKKLNTKEFRRTFFKRVYKSILFRPNKED